MDGPINADFSSNKFFRNFIRKDSPVLIEFIRAVLFRNYVTQGQCVFVNFGFAFMIHENGPGGQERFFWSRFGLYYTPICFAFMLIPFLCTHGALEVSADH